MIHPHTELRFVSKEVGYGVFATSFIPKGTITWVLDPLDQIIPKEVFRQIDPVMKPIVHRYTYRDQHGDYVLCWDNSKFVNHSFNCNCMSTAYECEIAIRDIHPGEELTDDYGFLNEDKSFECLPEQGANRKIVKPDDLLHFYKEWDIKLLDAFARFNRVEQPLKPILKPEYYETCRQIAENRAPMDSILNIYYDENNVLNGKHGHFKAEPAYILHNH